MASSRRFFDGVETRRSRIHLVIEAVTAALNKARQNGETWIPLKKTFADIEYDTGLTQVKIKTYADRR